MNNNTDTERGGAPPLPPLDDLLPTDDYEHDPQTLDPTRWAFFTGQLYQAGQSLARAARDVHGDDAATTHATAQWYAAAHRLMRWVEEDA